MAYNSSDRTLTSRNVPRGEKRLTRTAFSTVNARSIALKIDCHPLDAGFKIVVNLSGGYHKSNLILWKNTSLSCIEDQTFVRQMGELKYVLKGPDRATARVRRRKSR